MYIVFSNDVATRIFFDIELLNGDFFIKHEWPDMENEGFFLSLRDLHMDIILAWYDGFTFKDFGMRVC